MATSPWYREGTAKFTQGSTTVTGTGTRWVDFVRAGDGIQGPDGKLYQVTNVASNTSMSITPAYGSETTYWTIPIQGYVKRLADAASQLVRDLEGGATEALDAADRAKQSATEANASEAAALSQANRAESEADRAETEADRSQQAADDAVAVVTDGGGSIDPEAGKWPVAGADGTIKQAWVHELEFALDKLRVATNKALYGDGPYPDLDFQFQGANMLDPRIEFTRSSLDWDEYGNEYEINDPILTDKGHWVSGARSNLVKWSGDLTKSDWLISGLQYFRAAYPTIHPQRGPISATLYGPKNGQGSFSTGVVRQAVTLQSDETYTIWLDVKSSDPEYITAVRPEFLMSGGVSVPVSGVFSLTSEGLPTAREDNDYYRDVQVNNIGLGEGWRRLSLTFTVLSSNLEFTLRFYPYYGGTSVVGDGENGLIVSNVQVEKSGAPTSHIPTEGGQVTVAESKLGGINVGQAKSFVVDMQRVRNLSSVNTVYLATLSSFPGQFIPTDGVLIWAKTSTQIIFKAYRGGSGFEELHINGNWETARKIGFSVSGGLLTASVDGEKGSIYSQELANAEYLLSYLNLSQRLTDQSKYSWIRSVACYDRALTASQLQELTLL